MAQESPNTIKAVLNKAGTDQATSIFTPSNFKQKTLLEVAIELDIKAEDAIKYHKEFLMLLWITEFSKVHLLNTLGHIWREIPFRQFDIQT
ncbi:MAG: hypothetical protein ACRD8Z_10275 [Nitrososphaeraceae archaeon]